MPKAVICAYARTPIGKFRGALANYSATELGSKVVEELLKIIFFCKVIKSMNI